MSGESGREKAGRIAMSGASGFVGTHLGRIFNAEGWEVLPLGRADFALPAAALARRLEGVDSIVNLAGAPVLGRRWTGAYKTLLRASRIDLSRRLAEACCLMERQPRSFLSASAVGIYAAAAGRVHSESDHLLADDFLGRLARDWEAEVERATACGIRTVICRFGIVLGKGGGALQPMLRPFQLGLGGCISDGGQPFPWIHLSDLGRFFLEALTDASCVGVYNLVAPELTTNRGLTQALAQALGRPAFLRIPRAALWLRFGEGATILTTGQAVRPQRLMERGFRYAFPTLGPALADCIH